MRKLSLILPLAILAFGGVVVNSQETSLPNTYTQSVTREVLASGYPNLDLSWLGFSEEFTQMMGNCDWRIEPSVFITKAHWLVHKQMTVEAKGALEEFCFAPNAPSALLFKNLPVDNLLPLTPKTSGTSAAKCPISEGLILGIGRCFGQPFTYPYLKDLS